MLLVFSDKGAKVGDIVLESGDSEIMYFEVQLMLDRIGLPVPFFDGLYTSFETDQNSD